MNWYELAGPDEVREVLEGLLRTYDFITIDYQRKGWNGDPIHTEIFPKEKFEIAEALWGEYGEEVL